VTPQPIFLLRHRRPSLGRCPVRCESFVHGGLMLATAVSSLACSGVARRWGVATSRARPLCSWPARWDMCRPWTPAGLPCCVQPVTAQGQAPCRRLGRCQHPADWLRQGKDPHRRPARELCISPLFAKRRAYGCPVVHPEQPVGLVAPEQVLAPYDMYKAPVLPACLGPIRN
jgi:hypothetical protein